MRNTVSVLSAAWAGGAFVNSSSGGGSQVMEGFPVEVTGRVDTHKHAHVAAAIDSAGRLLGAASFAADAAGYQQLLVWLESWGTVACVGVEGTGS